LAVVVLLIIANHLTAAPTKDGQAEAEAILNKAMKVLGGEDKLTKLNTFVVKSREKTTVSGVEKQSIESTHSYEFPDKMRFEYKAQAPRMKGALEGVQVFNGEHAWCFTGGTTIELPNDHLMYFRHYPFHEFPVRLLPLLKGKDYKLTLVGDAKVEERRATVIMASREGAVDMKYFFDKDSGLLLKQEYLYTRSEDSGDPQRASPDDPKAMKVEILYEEYKESGGIKYPSRSVRLENGETRVGEITEFKIVEKFDEKTFAKPE
jgi:outer membrane lipoprotein-sorting protein